MKKIFKYNVDADSNTSVIPLNAQVLRVAHVDDGFYNGDFLWAIVDTDKLHPTEVFSLDEINPLTEEPWHKDLTRDQKSKKYNKRIQLAVKEKQTIVFPGYLNGAQEDDGKIYVHGVDNGISPPIEYEIAVYKTGQVIDLPVEKLRYLGLNRLWIIQELGLYTFLVLK